MLILSLFLFAAQTMSDIIEKTVDSKKINGKQKTADCFNRLKRRSDRTKKILAEIFDNVLAHCEQFLFAGHEDIFDLLDPVISDAQCQVHSLFIISKWLQIQDINNFQDDNPKRLSSVKLLSYVVLLSALKYEEKDEVGFIIYSQLVDGLGIFSGSVKAEKSFISNLKQTFNLYSIEYLKEISNGNIKKIFQDCNAILDYSKNPLQLVPCYVTFYTLFKYMAERNLPIVLSLTRFRADPEVSNGGLNIISKSLFYFEFQKSKNTFVFRREKDLSEEEMQQPTVTFNCFSIINWQYPKYFEEYMDGTELPSHKFLTEECDIRDLIMIIGAGHIQLINEEMDETTSVTPLFEQYSDTSVKPGPHPFKGNFNLIEKNVHGCYKYHQKIAEKFGIAHSRYSFKSQFLDQSNAEERSVLVNRRSENTFFTINHVKVLTYLKSSEVLNSYTVGSGVPLIEPKSFNKTDARTALETSLAKVLSSGTKMDQNIKYDRDLVECDLGVEDG